VLLFVDDRPVTNAPTKWSTIEDALRFAQSSACEPGRLVVRLKCDGSDVPEESLATTLRREAAACARLEIFTSTRRELIQDTMHQASVSLQDTEVACQRIAAMLTEGDTEEGMKNFRDCLSVWQQVHRAVSQAIQLLGMDAERVTLAEEPLAAILARPRDVLTQVRDALRVHDHVLLADLLQYEFSDVTNQWFALIARIREEAEGFENPADSAG
jgi:hypothetical protein